MAQVNHPNIISIYDYGSFSIEDSEKTMLMEYIAMEYIPGRTLRHTMSEEGFFPEEDLTREWLKKIFYSRIRWTICSARCRYYTQGYKARKYPNRQRHPKDS